MTCGPPRIADARLGVEYVHYEERVGAIAGLLGGSSSERWIPLALVRSIRSWRGWIGTEFALEAARGDFRLQGADLGKLRVPEALDRF